MPANINFYCFVSAHFQMSVVTMVTMAILQRLRIYIRHNYLLQIQAHDTCISKNGAGLGSLK